MNTNNVKSDQTDHSEASSPPETNLEAKGGRGIDWPIVSFFVLAYLIAWGAYLVMIAIADRSGISDVNSLLGQAEIFQYEDYAEQLIVPGWL